MPPLRLLLAALVLSLVAMPALGAPTTLKIASLAPDGSLWMKEMRAAGEAIATATEGRVAIKFYPGGVMGDDATVLRKIRLGQLQGGAFTGSELTLVYGNAQIYSLPFLFADYDQVDAARAVVDAQLVAGFERSGFRIVGISGVGFAYLMGTKPLRSTEALRATKVWVPQNDRIAELAFRAGGVEPVPLPLGDVFTSLQTGMVDTVGNTYAGAIALQWHTKVAHVFDLPLTYVVGYVALQNQAFERVAETDRQHVIAAFGAAARRIDAGNRRADAEAREVLAAQGVVFASPDPADVAYWNRIGRELTQRLVDEGTLDAGILASIRTATTSARPASEP
jgi:TRAP-type C4-dicarboxylate transport system substrate-binding protein